MGLAEDAARVAAERNERLTADEQEHSGSAQAAILRATEQAREVELALGEALAVLSTQSIRPFTTFKTERPLLSRHQNIVTGLSGWPVAGHFLSTEGDLCLPQWVHGAHPQRGREWRLDQFAKSAKNLDPKGVYVASGSLTRVDLKVLSEVKSYSRYFDHSTGHREHATPEGTDRIILGMPIGPLLGHIRELRDSESSWETKPLLEAIQQSVLFLVETGGTSWNPDR